MPEVCKSEIYNAIRNLDGSEREEFVKEAIEILEEDYANAMQDTRMEGNLEKLHRDMPGIIAWRFSQLQEIEAILEHLNIQKTMLLKKHHKNIMDTYNRSMSSTDIWKYAEAEEEVISMSDLINSFALVRNKWQGVIKALKTKEYQLGNINRLYSEGLETTSLK